MTAEKRSAEREHRSARKVGALALESLATLAVRVHGPAGSPEAAAALADLRALMAGHEERSREAASTAAECARLRAALERLYEWCDAELVGGERPTERLEQARAALREGAKP